MSGEFAKDHTRYKVCSLDGSEVCVARGGGTGTGWGGRLGVDTRLRNGSLAEMLNVKHSYCFVGFYLCLGGHGVPPSDPRSGSQ